MKENILWFKDISIKDVALVGGKNASLGEMHRFAQAQSAKRKAQSEIPNIPDGFALTTNFYWRFIEENGLDKKLKEVFAKLEPGKIVSLQQTSQAARSLILNSKISADLEKEIFVAYQKLGRQDGKNCAVAVRSSGVAEDSPKTSFAGQFETFLNVSGEKQLLETIKKCLASAFSARVIAYREQNRIDHLKFALSIGVQKMVRSDLASSGVIFTMDTETGFDQVVVINAIWGVGEMIVKGKITPDEFQVFKPTKAIIVKNLGRKTDKYIYGHGGGLREAVVTKSNQEKFCLTDDEVLTLANWAVQIEKHYGAPQDIEWAKDGPSRGLFIVQSRPETVQANKIKTVFEEYQLKTKKQPVLQGIAVGGKIGQGKVKIISRVSKINQFKTGGVLVTRMTDPDWLPAMRLASAIVTDEGGRTCHAAIVARELGVPAIVGTGQATKILKNGQETTVDCSTGRGLVFAGQIPFKTKIFDLKKLPKIKTKIMVNVGAPETAFKTSFLPARGVGLARTEFILAEKIKIHPLALYHYRKLKTQSAKLKTTTQNLKLIEEITKGYPDKRQYFIDELAEGIAQIAAAFCPRPVILRLSDLKSNEYRALIGGELFEPQEQNPMLGWRGASRYYDPKFQPAFEMECRAIKKVREEMGLKNLWLMVPFCRTPEEGKRVLNLLAKNGLSRNNDLKVMVMAEIPSNAILADEFLKIFDGFSIGSNDLTQLVLGLDRDSGFGQKIGDERNAAVKQMISQIIKVCREKGKSVGICGDAPSTFPDFIEFLVKEGIQSISVSPDALVKTINEVAKIEKNV